MDALMQNVHAVHICNWDEYVSSLRPWLPWIVAYDNNRNGRWLPDFWAMLTALPADQVAFLRTDFIQSITGTPYSNVAWDMWIELLVHSRNVNNVAQIRAAGHQKRNQKEAHGMRPETDARR